MFNRKIKAYVKPRHNDTVTAGIDLKSGENRYLGFPGILIPETFFNSQTIKKPSSK